MPLSGLSLYMITNTYRARTKTYGQLLLYDSLSCLNNALADAIYFTHNVTLMIGTNQFL
jgi:hypothetical protein